MEKHLINRPRKIIYKKSKIDKLRNQAIKKVKDRFLPNNKIIKIILIGSSIKNSFGEYYPPGFRGSLYSDFDFIFLVKDNYKIPKWLCRESSGKPFSENKLNLAYRNKNFINNKYDIETFFIREDSIKNIKIQNLAEKAGIPLKPNTKNKHIIIYQLKCKN